MKARIPHHILLVEPDASVRWVLEEVLREFGFVVHGAPDADTALEAVQGDSIDILVTDALVPPARLADLVSRTKSLHPHAPILLLSTNSAACPPGFRVMQKPVQGAELIDTALLMIAHAAYERYRSVLGPRHGETSGKGN